MPMFYDIIQLMLKLELYLSKIVKYGLYAILLTPLAFWPRALYGFMTPKFILFQVLVEIVFGAWLILKIIDFRNQRYLLLALFGFLVVSFISAIFGVDFSRSLWGIGARMTGLFAELHFLAWFLVLISTYNVSSIRMRFVNWNHYINFSFFIALVVALSAFYQNPDWRLTVYGLTIFNNPTFVAPYFLFHFFWGLYQRKWLFTAGSALILTALLIGGVRGAFIGLVIGTFFLGASLIFSRIVRPRLKILILVVFVLLFVGGLSLRAFRSSDFVQKTELLKRLSLVSLSETTAKTRLLTWQSALEGFRDRPFLGAGPENFNYLFNAHYNPKLLQFGGLSFAETWQDKPHNAFLEILTETGLIGIFTYALIWLAAVFALFKLFKSGQKFLSLTLAAAFISYLISMFLSFDSFGSWFGLYLFLAFLASRNNPNLPARNAFSIADAGGQNFKKLFIVFVCIGMLGLLSVNFSIWRANLADADALRYFSRNPAVGLNLFKKSLNYYTPYRAEYQFDLIASVSGAIEKNFPFPDLENSVNFALDEAHKALETHPNNAVMYTDMLKIYNILATSSRDPELLAQAENFGEKSLQLSPNRQETLFYLARTALLKGDTEAAVRLTENAVNIEPTINLSHWYLGLAYIANNQRQEGITEIKKALELGYSPQNQAEENFIKNIGL